MERIPFKPAEHLLSLAGPSLAVLGALLVLAALVALLARRRGPFAASRAARRLRVVERLALSRRASLLLVEVDGRPMLLGETAERLARLDLAPPDGEPS